MHDSDTDDDDPTGPPAKLEPQPITPAPASTDLAQLAERVRNYGASVSA